MDINSKIYVAGHQGLVGSAIVRKLTADGYTNLITISSKYLDLRNQQKVNEFFGIIRPEYIFLCAGRVGGIVANNTRRAEFIYDNVMIQANVIHAAYEYQCKKLLGMASSCCYPRSIEKPISEQDLLTGELEPTNEPYAVAKIAGIKMCEAYSNQYDCNFISCTPTNIYGSKNENFDLQSSHVLPALIRKFITAKHTGEDVTLWGNGQPRREFLHVDDMADACLFLMNNYNEPTHINIGTGIDIELNEVAALIAELTNFTGQILHDESKPSGMLRKRLDVSKINALGWYAKTDLRTGIQKTLNDIYATNKHLEWLH